MRELTSHKCGTLNSHVDIQVMDEPGEGNACHCYQIQPRADGSSKGNIVPTYINFQNGPIGENGVNGISDESLLAIVADRLEGFESGEFACQHNALALTFVREAMYKLHNRTRDRIERGVEGKSEK